MKTKLILLVLLFGFTLGSPQIGQAQLGKKLKALKDKAKGAVGDKPTAGGSATNDAFINEKYEALNQIIYPFEHGDISVRAVKSSLKEAQKLNWPKTLAELKKKKGSSSTNTRYGLLMNFPEKGTLDPYHKGASLQKVLLDAGNQYFDDSYKMTSTNKPRAIELLKEGKSFTSLLLALFPNHAQGKQLEADLDKALSELGASYTAKVFTSDFHRENAGKILFSKTPIEVGKEDPNQFTTSFSPTDKMYAIAYLEAPIKDLGADADKKNVQYSVQFNGKQENIFCNIPFEFHDQSYFIIEIMPEANTALHRTNAMDWYNKLSQISPRTQNMNLWLWINGKQVAEPQSKVALNWSGYDARTMKANAEKAVKMAAENYAKMRKLPAVFQAPIHQYGDAELSQANILKLFKARYPNFGTLIKFYSQAYREGATWDVKKNDLDIPTRKVSDGTFGITYRGKDGACYFVPFLQVQKTYEGGGRYGKATLIGGGPNKIACDKL